VGADAEKLEEIAEIATADERELQVEDRILAVVHIHRMNLRRPVEQVVERVATGAGDHDHTAVGAQLHQLPINPGILPAGVVDQLPAMHMVEIRSWVALKKRRDGEERLGAGIDGERPAQPTDQEPRSNGCRAKVRYREERTENAMTAEGAGANPPRLQLRDKCVPEVTTSAATARNIGSTCEL